jgi:hypothetical protein
MQRLLLTAPVFVVFLLGSSPEAFAQCVTIGARICQGGHWYYCRACGSEKCWIASSERCLREENIEADESRSRAGLRDPRRLSMSRPAACLSATGVFCAPGVARRPRPLPE